MFVLIPVGDPNGVEKTIRDSIDHDKWEHIEWIKTLSNYTVRNLKIRRKKSRIFDNFMMLLEYLFNFIDVRRLNFIARKYAPVIRVFTGHRNTQEHLAAKLKPSELLLMDSGTTFEKVRNSGYISYVSSHMYRGNIFAKIILKLIGFKIYDRRKTKLFTVYYDSIETNHELVKNNQLYKKHLVRKKTIGNDVIFISSPMYQVSDGVAIDTYIRFLREIMEHFKIDRKNFIYVPNPVREQRKDVDYIVKKLECQCDDRSMPVEMKITTYDELPKCCLSLYSTALVNIYPMVEDKIKLYAVWHPQFDYFKHIKDWKKEITANKKIKIEFVTIENATNLFHFDPKLLEKYREFTNHNDWKIKQGEFEKCTGPRISLTGFFKRHWIDFS